jgi:hypothetical protein
MDKNHIDLFIATQADKFKPEVLGIVKQKLEEIPDDQFIVVQSLGYQTPTTILLIALFLGWERFFLDDIPLGVLKVLTCGGLGIWYLVDIFTAFERTRDYNFRKFSAFFM